MSTLQDRINAARAAKGLPAIEVGPPAQPSASTAAQVMGKFIAACALLLLFAAVAWLAYGLLRPLFHGPVVTYWQMLALVWVLRTVRNWIEK